MKRLTIIAALLLIPTLALALDPGAFDLVIYANEDYVLNLTHKAGGQPINLTGYQFRLAAKKNATAVTPFLVMSSVVTNAAAGQTRHWLHRTTTAANASAAGVYDLMQTAPDGKVSYRLKGTIRILETVTR